MSVLAVPRIYFRGNTFWDPTTGNNNDDIPTYDAANTRLNFPYLKQFGITEDDFSSFPAWARAPQPDTGYQPTGSGCPVHEPPKTDYVPAEWDSYGTGGAGFITQDGQFNKPGGVLNQPYDKTAVSGGTCVDGSYTAEDSLVGKTVDLGPKFSGLNVTRMVDVNPGAFWCTQLIPAGLNIGSGDTVISAKKTFQVGRLHSRWLNVQRCYNVDGQLQIAGVAGAVFQGAVPFDQLDLSNAGDSTLAKQVWAAMQLPGAQGLMVRFYVYITNYFQGDLYEHLVRTQDKECFFNRISKLYEAHIVDPGSPNPSNRAYSRTVGTVGIWKDGEQATVPGGRYLVPANVVAASGLPAQYYQSIDSQAPKAQVALGPTVFEVHDNGFRLSVDLGNTFPELESTGTKADFGEALFDIDSTGLPLDYSQANYDKTSGIIDISLGDDFSEPSSPIGISVEQPSGQERVTALTEQVYTAQTDQRGVYIDQEETVAIQVLVNSGAQPAPAGTPVAVVQYWPYPLEAGSGPWIRIGQPGLGGEPSPDPYVKILNGDGQPMPNDVLEVGDGGILDVKLEALQPGFPNIAFFPPGAEAHNGGKIPDAIMPTYSPQFNPPPANGAQPIMSTFYTVARVLPFDDALYEEFQAEFGISQNSREAWPFVFKYVLSVYALIFPVMSFLAQEESVRGSAKTILALTNKSNIDSPTYMPVERGLSKGARAILQDWCTWVLNGT